MSEWTRLSPRMLLVHPVHEVLRQLPVLIGSIVLGSATGNQMWVWAALALTVALGVARWFTTTYRIDAEFVALRTGVLQRRLISLPRNRIRSVQTDRRLLHRLLGLTVLEVSTGQEAKGDNKFELDAVETARVDGLRATLLADSIAPASDEAPAGHVLARWRPSWLRFAPLSFSGLAMIAAAAGLASQAGIGDALRRSQLARTGIEALQHASVAVVIVVGFAVLIAASVALSVLISWLTYANLVLTVSGGVLNLRHGLLRIREHTFDLRRLRGGSLREPLLVRAMGGARLDAVMTGVTGEGESSLLLPAAPAATARTVLAELIGAPDAVDGPLRGHGPAARRRRFTRALTLPLVLAVVLAVWWPSVWWWVGWAVLTVCCALLAADRARALGHRVDDSWLVTRSGSLLRSRDCVASQGVIAWTVRQTWLQRRAEVATLVAATAAGRKSYQLVDVPAEWAWEIAASASPWVAGSAWAHRN